MKGLGLEFRFELNQILFLETLTSIALVITVRLCCQETTVL